MIIRDYYTTRDDAVKLFRTYSDKGFCIEKVETGEIYEEAIDVETASYNYIETDILIIIDDVQA